MRLSRSRSLRFEGLELRAVLSAAPLIENVLGPSLADFNGSWTAPHDSLESAGYESTPASADALHDSQLIDPSSSYFEVAGERVWNFAREPDHVSVAAGSWSDPTVWSSGRVPGDGETVQVSSQLTYALQNHAAIRAINIHDGGRLVFAPDANTSLRVGTLTVLPGGELEVGTPANPVSPDVTAEIIFADLPLDLADDPEQHGIGLVALDGSVTVHGAAMSPSFARLAQEAFAGDTTVKITSAVTGWRSGQKVILPDTRPYAAHRGISPHWEEARIRDVGADGMTVTLDSPLAFDHLGARGPDGTLLYLGHIGNLGRNVVFRSGNPEGTRGHVLFSGRAAIDIQYAAFQNLGRTEADVHLDSTVLDAQHNVLHVGTNQVGRYAVHFHHLIGPTADQMPSHGYQFRFTGNAVDRSPKWGVVLHGAHFGLIEQNVVYRADGAGIVLEDASESFNHIKENFVIAARGSGQQPGDRGKGNIPKMIQRRDGTWTAYGDPGHEGTGIWSRGSNNYYVGNVTASAGFAGMLIFQFETRYLPHVPQYQGADPELVGQFTGVQSEFMVPLAFEDNQSYGSRVAEFEFWNIGLGPSDFVVRDNVAWHVNVGLSTLYSVQLVSSGFTVIGDGRGVGFSSHPIELIAADWNIQGLATGLNFKTARNLDISDSYFRNRSRNIDLYSASNSKPARLVIRDVAYAPITGFPLSTIYHAWYPAEGTDHMQQEQVLVYNHNRTPGDDFQVLYAEQAADFVVPSTGMGSDTIAVFSYEGNRFFNARLAPVAGLTNAQLWETFGIAVAGGVAAPDVSTRPDIYGMLGPIPADLSPPQVDLSSIRISDVTRTSAVVRWTTTEPSTSRVEYAPYRSYYALLTTTQEPSLVRDHAVELTNLFAGQLYVLRIHSVDEGGNQSFPAPWYSIFTTLPAFPALEALIATVADIGESETLRDEVVELIQYYRSLGPPDALAALQTRTDSQSPFRTAETAQVTSDRVRVPRNGVALGFDVAISDPVSTRDALRSRRKRLFGARVLSENLERRAINDDFYEIASPASG